MSYLVPIKIDQKLPPAERRKLFRAGVEGLVHAMADSPKPRYGDDVAPLKHTFVPGAYVREITMPANNVYVTKVHKIEHAFFVLRGECIVATEDGNQTIKGPYWGVTKPGTQRVIYTKEETVWITVHVTDSTDRKEIEKQLISPTYLDALEGPNKGGLL